MRLIIKCKSESNFFYLGMTKSLNRNVNVAFTCDLGMRTCHFLLKCKSDSNIYKNFFFVGNDPHTHNTNEALFFSILDFQFRCLCWSFSTPQSREFRYEF